MYRLIGRVPITNTEYTDAEIESFCLDAFRSLGPFSLGVGQPGTGLIVVAKQTRDVVVLLRRDLHQPVVGRLQSLPDLSRQNGKLNCITEW